MNSHSIITNLMCNRYPSDTIDRFWWRFENAADNAKGTNETVNVDNNLIDLVPEAVMRTNYEGDNKGYTFNISSRPISTAAALSGTHRYYVGLWLVEFENLLQDNLRVFNITINDKLFATGIDLHKVASPAYTAAEVYSKTDESLGPYDGSVIIKAIPPLSIDNPTLAAGEVLQLFDNAINATTPTFSPDGR